MNTYQAKIHACGLHGNFKFNTILTDHDDIIKILSSGLKKGYSIKIKKINYHPNLDGRDIVWAYFFCKSFRFYKIEDREQSLIKTEEVTNYIESIFLPGGMTIESNSTLGDTTFFNITNTKNYAVVPDIEAIGRILNREIKLCAEGASHKYYCKGRLKFEPVSTSVLEGKYCIYQVYEVMTKQVIVKDTIPVKVEL